MVDEPSKNPQFEEILAEGSKLGTDGVAALPHRLDRYFMAHQRALLMADYARDYSKEKEGKKLSEKISRCGHYLVFRHYFTVDQLRLHAADFCKKHLLCPLCAVRRGAKYLKAYLDKLQCVRDCNPGLKAFLVTVTVKNGDDLEERFNHLRSAMKKMTQARRDHLKAAKNRHVEFAKALGGVHSIEVKRGSFGKKWHPHSHMIWLCHEPPDQEKLSKEWNDWTGDSHVVDVRPFHDQEDLVSGFCEVFKYALKFSELELSDNWTAFKLLSGNRLVDSFGLLRGVVVPDDLTDEPILDDLPYIELFYNFVENSGYDLFRTTRH